MGSPLRLGVTRRRRPEKALLLRPFDLSSATAASRKLRTSCDAPRRAGARAGSGAARRASSGSLGWRSARETVVVHFPWLEPCFSEQGGERAAGVVGGEQVAEVGEQRAVLQAASDRGRP